MTVMRSITTHKPLNRIGEQKMKPVSRRTILTMPSPMEVEFYERFPVPDICDTIKFSWVENEWYIETDELPSPMQTGTNIMVEEYAKVLYRYAKKYLWEDKPEEESNAYYDYMQCIRAVEARVIYAKKDAANETTRYYINIPNHSLPAPVREKIKKAILSEVPGYSEFVIEYGVYLLFWKFWTGASDRLEKKTQGLIKDMAYKKRYDYEKYSEKLNISKSMLKCMETETLAVMIFFYQDEVYESFLEYLKKIRIQYFSKLYKKKKFPKAVKESLNSYEIFERSARDGKWRLKGMEEQTKNDR